MDLKSIGSALLDYILPRSNEEQRLAYLTASAVSSSAPLSKPTPTGTEALLNYRDRDVQALIKTLKYRGRRESAVLLAEILYAHLLEDLGERELYDNFSDPVFVPIPLAPARLRERGFNQTEWILEEFRKLDNSFEIQKLTLVRTKHTKSQTKQKGREARMHNLSGAFTLKRPELINDRNVVLIDDVVTTGATLREAQKTLLEGGAKKVLCVALAH